MAKIIVSNIPEYRTWSDMKTRCYNPNFNEYQHYGGRGIKVCDEWKDNFLAFYEYLGSKPSKEYSLDRIDPNGNYEPGNVKWSNRRTQQLNKRNIVENPKAGIVEIQTKTKGTRWSPRVSIMNKIKSLGTYDTFESAFRARQLFLKEYENG